MTARTPETVIALSPSERPCRLNQPTLRKPQRHRWGDKTVISPNKTERECCNGCGTIKVSRRETEGGRDIYWTEFWRGLDPISTADGKTPVCEPVLIEEGASA